MADNMTRLASVQEKFSEQYKKIPAAKRLETREKRRDRCVRKKIDAEENGYAYGIRS
jgi:hypothetical protein